MALVKFFIFNLIIRFFCMLERRCVNHDILIPRGHKSASSKEYVFLTSYKKPNIFINY